MHPFEFYLKLGFEHIANLNGYDHILFLVVLCAVYQINQWRNIIILVTAFTIGHSITLFIVSLDFFSIPSRIIKLLIPVTILITSLQNIINVKQIENSSRMGKNYFMALFFGLIHGMDFSNYFKALIRAVLDGQMDLVRVQVNSNLSMSKKVLTQLSDLKGVKKPTAEMKAAVALVMVVEFGLAAMKPYIQEVLDISNTEMSDFYKIFFEARELGLNKFLNDKK